MGGIEFEWKGKTYDIYLEGGYPLFDNADEAEAFGEWRKSKEGISVYGPLPKDWSKEHYLDERYPWDDEKGHRVDVEALQEKERAKSRSRHKLQVVDDEDEFVEPYIEWTDYDKCRYGCYRYFYLTNESHVCGICGIASCAECAKDDESRCEERSKRCVGCQKWICGAHGDKEKKCEICSELSELG